MNLPATGNLAQTGLLAGWTAQRTAWLLFAPPAVMLALRWLLQLLEDRQVAAPALPLVPVGTTSGLADLLWPAAMALALLAAAGWLVRRLGWRRIAPLAGAAWLALWLAGSGALMQRHLNRQGLFLQSMAAGAASVTVQVIANPFKPPSLRSLGGANLVLQVPGLEVPHRLLIDDLEAVRLKPGDSLALQLAPGRFNGLFVTGWRPAADALPAAPRTSAFVSSAFY